MDEEKQPLLYDIELEAILIGECINFHDYFSEVTAIISTEDFYSIRHKSIFDAIKAVGDDFKLITTELKKNGKLDEVGGASYLTKCMIVAISSMGMSGHALKVREYAYRRDYVVRLGNIAKSVFDMSVPVASLDSMSKQVAPPLFGGVDFVTDLLMVASELDDDLDRGNTAIACHTSTGFGLPNLTECIGGIPFGAATLVAAPTRTGKTALLTELAEVAATNGRRVLYVSTEMSAKAILRRKAAAAAQVSTRSLRGGTATAGDIEAVKQAAWSYVSQYSDKLFFDDRANSVNDIRRSVDKYKPDLLIVDHLGELSYKGDNKTIGMGDNFTHLRQLVRDDKGLALVVAHQIDVDLKPGQRPQLSDLRWAKGDLSEKSDLVLMMYRPDLAEAQGEDQDAAMKAVRSRGSVVPVEIWTRKDRDGGTDILIGTMFELIEQKFRKPDIIEMRAFK